MDGFSSLGGGLSACLNASVKIFEITYQLKAVEQQTSDLLSTTRLVDHDVKEARRLRRLKVAFLGVSERAWMDGVIDHTESALRAVAQLIEPARVDKTTSQGINFGNRVMWVFRDNPQVRDRHQRLVLCHQSLTAVISCLYSKDMVGTAPMADDNELEEQPPPYDSELHDFLSWRHRKRSHVDLTERGNRATGSPSSTRSRSIASTEISQSSPRRPSNLNRLSSQASLTKEIPETYATVPERQSPPPTSDLFETAGEQLNNNPLLHPPARSQRPTYRPWHNNDQTGQDSRGNEVSNSTAASPTLDIQLRDQDSLFRWTLPEIDTSSLTGMINEQAFHHHHHHGSHDGFGIHDDAACSTTVSAATAAASAADSPHLTPPDHHHHHPPSAWTGLPTTSEPNCGYDDWSTKPQPPGRRHRCNNNNNNNNNGPESSWTETHAIGPPRRWPPITITGERRDDDDQGPTVVVGQRRQHGPDAARRVPCCRPTCQEQERCTAVIAAPRTGGVRRGSRDWLAYQATRGGCECELGHWHGDGDGDGGF